MDNKKGLLGQGHEFLVRCVLESPDLPEDRPGVAHGLHHVSSLDLAGLDFDVAAPAEYHDNGIRDVYRLETRLGPTKYGLWFDDSTRIRYEEDDATLRIAVQSRFHADWIRSNFTNEIDSSAGRRERASSSTRDASSRTASGCVSVIHPGETDVIPGTGASTWNASSSVTDFAPAATLCV